MAGSTGSSDFPTTHGAYDTAYNGGDWDAFVSKFDAGLTSLLASTFLGGMRYDFAYSIAIDSSGNVYVAGLTYSLDFPTTAGAYDTAYNPGGPYGGDAFLSKLDSYLSFCVQGDADRSGNVSILDAILVLRLALGLTPLPDSSDRIGWCVSDINADSSIDIQDVVKVMRRALALE